MSFIALFGSVLLAIALFDLVIVLALMLALRFQRSHIADAPFTPVRTNSVDPLMHRTHRHNLPLQDGWTRAETLNWAKSGHTFPSRLFRLRQMVVTFRDDEACPICQSRALASSSELGSLSYQMPDARGVAL